MDRSLWLLLRLRGLAWTRRWTRNLRSLKGALLGVVGALLFLPMVLSAFFARGIRTADQLEFTRHYGAFAFFAFCLLQVLVSAGERALYYSPAEINFLFSGPYRPRQLLLYKITSAISASFILSIFLMFTSSAHAGWLPAAFVGLFLGIVLLFLFTLVMGLLMILIGTLAFSRLRQLVLAGAAVGVLIALLPAGRAVQVQGLRPAVDAFLETQAATVLLLPFQPFVRTFTATRLWPDLVGWGLVSLAVDLAVLGLVLAVNAQFIETSVNVSSKIYARIQRFKRGESVVATPSTLRFAVPMFPWWRGAGPNLWRQLVTLTRSWQKLVSVLTMFMMPAVAMLIVGQNKQSPVSLVAPALAVLVSVGLFAPTLIGFDFRTDLSRMEDLKTLPVRPSALVVGQLVTPVLVLSAVEWLVLGFLAWLAPSEVRLLGIAAVLVPPANFLMVAIDNLYFLWFPFRLTGFNAFDFQAIGRQTLLMMAKLFTLLVVLALAAGAAALPYYVLNGSWAGAVVAAWVVVAAAGLAVIPLLSHAFVAFDVAEVVDE